MCWPKSSSGKKPRLVPVGDGKIHQPQLQGIGQKTTNQTLELSCLPVRALCSLLFADDVHCLWDLDVELSKFHRLTVG
jgi:hypothetical protein